MRNEIVPLRPHSAIIRRVMRKPDRVKNIDTVSSPPVIHVTLDSGARMDVSDIPNLLVNQGFRITQFTEEAVNLETAFMRLAQGLVQ